MQALAANYNKVFEPNLLGLWMRLLASYSVADVESAVIAIVETRPYPTMPTYADLRKYLPGTKALATEDVSALKAQQEFDLVWQAVCQHGSRNEPLFSDTTAAVLRSLGGWQAICQTWQENERHWKEKEFVRLWQLYEGKEYLLGAGAQGVSTGLALGAPEATAALESPVPAGVCPECHGTGWITAWREGKLTSSAFACTCNEYWTGKRYTRQELAADGWLFTEPKRPKKQPGTFRQRRTQAFPALRKDFQQRIAQMEIDALESAGQTRLASEKRAALQRQQEAVSQAIA